MSLPRVYAIAGRVIAQFRRDHRTLALMFIAPLVIMSILGYIFRAQESSTVSVALVNEDRPANGQQSLAAPVIDSLKADTADLQVTEMASRDDAVSAVRDGRQRVALIFPASFTQDLTSTRKSTVEAVVEGSNPGQVGPALATVGQAVLKSAPEIYKSLISVQAAQITSSDLFKNAPPQAKQMLPALLSSVAPAGPPVSVSVTRLYGSADLKPLDFFAPMFIVYIGFFLIFLLTCVSFLRERTQGTMERLAASPVTRIELVLGYMLGFGFFAMLQATVLLLFTIYALQIHSGNIFYVFIITLVMVLGAVNLGIFLSAFARNELQAVQFIPIVIIPQVLLSGLLWPVQDMPAWLQVIARIMPATYAIDALTDIMIRGKGLLATWVALLVLFVFAVLAAILAARSVQREVA